MWIDIIGANVLHASLSTDITYSSSHAQCQDKGNVDKVSYIINQHTEFLTNCRPFEDFQMRIIVRYYVYSIDCCGVCFEPKFTAGVLNSICFILKIISNNYSSIQLPACPNLVIYGAWLFAIIIKTMSWFNMMIAHRYNKSHFVEIRRP